MTRTSRRRRAGFTLLELVIALSLSSIVLIGVFSMMASMMTYEAEGLRKGSVNAWSLASLVAMNREIEGASVFVYASASPPQTLVVCSNWSRLLTASGVGAKISAIDNVTVYNYCWDQANNLLRRSITTGAGVTCPSSVGFAPLACNSAAYGGASSVIATGVFQDSLGDPIFTADPTSTGTIRIRYVVGNPSAGVSANEGNGLTNFVNPQTMAFDTRITLDKAVGGANSSD